MVLLIPDGIRALKEQRRKEKERQEQVQRNYAATLESVRREGYDEGMAQGRREAREECRIEGFQQGYKDGLEQGRREERQRVIQALARLESPQDRTMQITMTLSQYIEVVLGEPSDPAT